MVLAIIFVAWVLATLAGTMREFLADKNKTFYGVIVTVNFFFVPLTIILGAYGTIFHIARAHARGRGVSSFKKVLLFRLDYQPFKWCSRTRHCKYRNVRKFITFCSKAIKRRGDNVFGIYIKAGSSPDCKVKTTLYIGWFSLEHKHNHKHKHKHEKNRTVRFSCAYAYA